jgi:L-alanine-DL-glutamate epimerase-like enolase superfamily enzyme
VRLRNAAVARRSALDRALSQSFVELALLTSTRQVPVEAALEDLLVQAQVDPHLRELLQEGAWRRLVTAGSAASLGFERSPLTSHAAIYDAIGRAYDVPAFALLGSSLQRINDKGQSPGEVLTALARTTAENEVADMLVRSEQARIRQAIPVGLMIVPLLVLVGYPLVSAMTAVLGT